MNQAYSQQRRITGRQSETYRWVDRKTPSARHTQSQRAYVYETPNDNGANEQHFQQIIQKCLAYAMMIVFVSVVFLIVGKLATLQKEADLIAKLNYSISEISEENDRLKKEKEYETRSYVIEDLASKQLGMYRPASNAISFVHVEGTSTLASVQTAEGSVRSR